MLAADVAQENVGGIGVGERSAEVAVIDVDPVFECHVVGMLVAELCAVEHEPLMRMCAEGLHVVLHGKVAVGRAGTVMGVLVQVTDDGVLHGEGKTASCTKFREGQFVVVRQLHFFSQFGTDLFHVGHMAEEFIAQFGDYRKQRDFIEGGFVHEIVYVHKQLPVVIERDMYLFRMESHSQ